MKRVKFLFLSGALAASLVFAAACESPDSQARFDEYSEIVGDAPPQSELCDASIQDLSGKYFLRLQHSISANNHILMELDVVETGDNNYTLNFIPLKADILVGGDPRPDAREPVGDPIVLENISQNAAGEFEVNLVDITVGGEANSFTGGDIVATINLTVAACDKGFLCGKGDLSTSKPLTFRNQKANFGAVAVDSIDQDSKAPIDCTSEGI